MTFKNSSLRHWQLILNVFIVLLPTDVKQKALSPTKLIGDFCDNREQVANCSVSFSCFNFICLSDRNDQRIARMTGKEKPELSEERPDCSLLKYIDGMMNPESSGDNLIFAA
jgi:hypothetical protein